MVRCPACRKPVPNGQVACPACGHILWLGIFSLFFGAFMVKAGAVAVTLWLEDGLTSGFFAWSGSLFAGFLFLGGVLGIPAALRQRAAARSSFGGRSFVNDIPALPMTLFAFAVSFAFVLVGNPHSRTVAIWSAPVGVLLVLLGIVDAVNKRIPSPAKSDLRLRRVGDVADPPPPPASRGIIALSDGTIASPPALGGPVPLRRGPETGVRFRAVFHGGRMIGDLELAVLFDGEGVGLGSFRLGFDVRATTTVGVHELELRCGSHTQTFAVHFPGPGDYEAELHWSFFAAKFLSRDDRDNAED